MALWRSASKLGIALPRFLPRSPTFLHYHATSFGFKEVREEEKSQLVGNVFTSVASNYDLMNDLMSAGLHRLWKDRLVVKLHPFPGMKHLDVAGGTGDVAFRVLESINSVSRRALDDGLAKIEEETKIYVCDINPNMLNVGKKRAVERGLGEDHCLCWVDGDAEALSFGDASMDGYTIAFGIRNVTHIERALTEAYRVLKRGGRFLCLELSHVEFPGFKQLYDYYSFSVIPAMGELVAGDRESYQYLIESIRRFPTQMWNGPICNLSGGLLSKFGGDMSRYGEGTNDQKFGFQRSEFGYRSLVGTVQMYDRHVFLCYKTPGVWPPQAETTELDSLPKLLSSVIKARKGDMKRRVQLTICEGEDGTQGDVLIFPDMIRYKQLAHYDVDNFVEKVLVEDTEWPFGKFETLSSSYVFVCAHGSRDQRCGVCGPVLVNRFKEEIHSRGIQGLVSVRACSHIGGHKYAGNVIIFSPNNDGEVTGHWYGYVTPNNVPILLEQHIGKGKIIEHLWRGQMGLSKEDQRKSQVERLQLNGVREGKSADEPNASN